MNQTSLMEKIRMTTVKKIELVTKSPARYFVRAMLATVFLTLATTVSFLLADYIQSFLLLILPHTQAGADAAYNMSKIVYALSFGWALVMILYMNTELFTSNAMYFSTQLFNRTIKFKPTLRVLLFCYIGNFVGAVLISLLFVYSGTFTAANSQFAEHVVLAKLAKEPLAILLQAIIANMVVNTAVILTIQLKDDISKIIAIIITVFIFAYFGSEHVIANFSSLSLVGFATGFANMSVSAILINFFFATIGNLIGGGLIIGVIYAWLNKGDFKYKD